jgi:glycerophosphoryl diester phosphodiesterase
VYTVNDPARMDELRRRGVAGVFTDVPSAMLAHRDAG